MEAGLIASQANEQGNLNVCGNALASTLLTQAYITGCFDRRYISRMVDAIDACRCSAKETEVEGRIRSEVLEVGDKSRTTEPVCQDLCGE